MLEITARSNFNYKIFLKRKAYFLLYVLPHLAGRREIAIRRSKHLEAAFMTTQRHHECNPCTKIHHLVTSILSFV
jgi:hypothetical protein